MLALLMTKPTYISLLRGINISGQKRIKMAELRDVYVNIGFDNVQSYIASGNLVFEYKKENHKKIEELVHKAIKEIRGTGLMLALIMETPAIANQVILRCKDKNLILFWLLFEPRAIRISPPLTISNAEIIEGCTILSQVLNEI